MTKKEEAQALLKEVLPEGTTVVVEWKKVDGTGRKLIHYRKENGTSLDLLVAVYHGYSQKHEGGIWINGGDGTDMIDSISMALYNDWQAIKTRVDHGD